jgi:NAD(P)-dependent dehydrogenase (short-subunit alcohol dehydrogenase family)
MAATGNPGVDVARLKPRRPEVRRGVRRGLGGAVAPADQQRGITSPAGPHTLDALEPHFAANHLGHFAFARALHRALAAADGARIVVSSSAHLFSPVVFDDIHFWLAMPGGR